MQSVKQELYSRRDNLVFTGISDHQEETNDQCKKSLFEFFQKQLKMTPNATQQMTSNSLDVIDWGHLKSDHIDQL